MHNAVLSTTEAAAAAAATGITTVLARAVGV